MMNQLRHNFTKPDRLSLQLIPMVQQFSAQFTRQSVVPSASIDHVRQCDWQSATYEGEIRHYNMGLVWQQAIEPDLALNDFITALQGQLDDYEFDILRSFVASVTITNSAFIAQNRLSLDIKMHIIHEE